MINFHVRGIGTIGEPLANMLCDLVGNNHGIPIGDITFSKATNRNMSRVENLIQKGARFVTDSNDVFDPEIVSGNEFEAMTNAHVILDCTPSNGALSKRSLYWELLANRKYATKRVIAQGSENGFGLPFVAGVSEMPDVKSEGAAIQIKSCNTTAMSAVAKEISDSITELGFEDFDVMGLDFTCVRRANDIYQKNGNLSVNVGLNYGAYGTHHAEDVDEVMKNLDTFHLTYHTSRALKVPTQFMHTISFSMTAQGVLDIDTKSLLSKMEERGLVGLTDLTDSCEVFSYGRDYGYMGRNLDRAIVPKNSLNVNRVAHSNEGSLYQISGAIFTPQDANTLLGSLTAAIQPFWNGSDTKGLFSLLSEYFGGIGKRL